MFVSNIPYMIILLLLSFPSAVHPLWTNFDLVRNRLGAWGSNGTTPYTIIIPGVGQAPNVPAGSQFGFSVADISDLDGDGVNDLAVGAPSEGLIVDGAYQPLAGAVYILLMTTNGTVKASGKISALDGNGPKVYANDEFGYSIASIGDLDGDGVNDLAVGAPGAVVSAVHILFMKKDMSVKSSVMIRGAYNGDLNKVTNASYAPNGPPIQYQMRFGSSVASIGDLNKDGIPELAVGALSFSSGNHRVFILFLQRNGTVQNYTTLGSGVGGGPILQIPFSGFGSSILSLGDINGDGVNHIVIGAKYYEDFVDSNTRSGALFVCSMHHNGTIKKYVEISMWSEQSMGFILPWAKDYNCGAALGTIGDINLDKMKPHKPTLVHPDRSSSYADIIVGCPAPDTGIGTGTMYLLFMKGDGYQHGYKEIPGVKDIGTAPKFKAKDKFGNAIAGYQDLDKNGIREVVVGSPGHNNSDGALYILFMRRRRFHPPVPNTFLYYFKIFFPIGFFTLSCCFSCCYFFWYFRRRPDEIEIAVLQSNIEVGAQRKRAVVKRSENANLNDDEYPS